MKARETSPPFLRCFGDAVRGQRESLNLSQEQLSFASKLDRTYISGIERGVRNPTLQSMQRVAAALKVSLSVLLQSAEALSESTTPRPRRSKT